ncbi:MAG: response regulator transcription factor, partial [Coriobacteriales bacterium]|nr:response regulator transcription factor [Coriobacteriales bacterium]
MKLLLIDDELAIHRLIERVVLDAGYEFCAVTDGETLDEVVRQEKPDLILLDVMLPGQDGFQLCAHLRERGLSMPIIFLTAKGDIVDKRVGFEAGADDYIVKPFSTQELLLRIDAHLRKRTRSILQEDERIEVGGLELDAKRHE